MNADCEVDFVFMVAWFEGELFWKRAGPKDRHIQFLQVEL
jgi:hypothetical protein